MTEENPYAPPKSEDFKLPENNKKPSKWRVFWWIYSLSFVLISIIVILIPSAIISFLDRIGISFAQEITSPVQEIYSLCDSLFLFSSILNFVIFLILYAIYLIPITIVLFVIQYLVKNIKDRIIYSLIVWVIMELLCLIIFGFSTILILLLDFSYSYIFIAYMIAIYFIVKKVNDRILNYS